MIRHELYGSSADVFSYAIVLWQLITREHPYSDTQSATEAAAAVALEDKRPPLPTGTPQPIATIIETCWDRDPDARPAFEALVTRLAALEPNADSPILTAKERTWLSYPRGHPVYAKTIARKKDAASPDGKGPKLIVPKQRRRGLFNRKSVHF